MIDKVFAGRYRITEKIGIGGMAEVYKATDETLGRTVAVKVMLPQYAQDQTFAVRFKQEAQAAANLQSPYIVNIYDWGYEETSQTYFIVMEYIRGTDLKTAITQRGAINQRKVAEIGSQVAAALGVAHSYDVIHRDIKPQNIMVQPDGNAKVMDFGIARANNANLTQTGSVLGTAYYVSPEQAQGKELTSASDIYSLGVVLYEAATGRVPFDGPDAVSIAVKQVNEMPLPPRAIDANIDAGLEAIILKAMQKNPADRFRTADEMRMALGEYLQGKPIQHVNHEALTQVITKPTVVPPAAATAVMPELATAATHTRAGSYNRGSQEPPEKSKVPLIVALVASFALLLAGVAIYLAFCSGNDDKVEVPRVIGFTQEEATAALTAADLVVGDVKIESSETIEAGHVMSQNPAASSRVAAGTAVNLVISSGTGNVEVPTLTNMTQSEAQQALAALNLVFVVGDSKPSDNIESGRVISSNPEAGSKVPEGTKVYCTISSGPEKIPIPNVLSMGMAEAEELLLSAGFKVEYAADVYSYMDAGLIFNQTPTGQALRGQTITLTVSLGPEPLVPEQVKVPDFTNMTLTEAIARITNMKINIDFSGDTVTGRVLSQDYPADTMVDQWTTINLVFG